MQKSNPIPTLLAMAFGLFLLVSPAFAQENFMYTDQKLADRLETEMFYQMDVPAEKIDLEVNDQIVTLSGKVPHLLAKTRAEKVAKATKGVRAVINQIEVQSSGISDEALEKSIEVTLENDPVADPEELVWKVDQGIVTLSGEVESWQEKYLLTDVLQGVRAVVEVKNRIDVRYDDSRSDSEIKAEVEAAILNDIRLRPSFISVTVDKGIVGLSGTVGNLIEKQMAESYAWTSGVKEVSAASLKIKKWSEKEVFRDNRFADRTDEEIEEAVKLAFLYDPRVVAFNPTVSVNDGVVVLKGTVNNIYAKLAAADDARNVVGVAYVKNHLKVRPTVMMPDQVLKTEVDNLITRDPMLGNLDITAEVQDGTLYLTGDVYTQQEKERVERLTGKIEGVESIRNFITVRDVFEVESYYPYALDFYPSPYVNTLIKERKNMTDNQIEASIQSEWWWSTVVNSGDLDVSVADGKAILTGQVSSWYERRAAILDAYQGGADQVVDRMIVDPEAY